MAANAAHELRTPLAVATLRLQTALDRGVDNTDVRAAYEALERLRQRTEKLLQLSRAASGSALAQDEVRQSEEHTSELQSPCNLVCRLLLEKKKKIHMINARLSVSAR